MLPPAVAYLIFSRSDVTSTEKRAHHPFFSSARPIEKLYLLWDGCHKVGILKEIRQFSCYRFFADGEAAGGIWGLCRVIGLWRGRLLSGRWEADIR